MSDPCNIGFWQTALNPCKGRFSFLVLQRHGVALWLLVIAAVSWSGLSDWVNVNFGQLFAIFVSISKLRATFFTYKVTGFILAQNASVVWSPYILMMGRSLWNLGRHFSLLISCSEWKVCLNRVCNKLMQYIRHTQIDANLCPGGVVYIVVSSPLESLWVVNSYPAKKKVYGNSFFWRNTIYIDRYIDK
jgi:hypothetical protein